MNRQYYGKEWRFGEKYAYVTKETCFRVAQEAIACGHEVRFGKTDSGFCSYYFEIVDPFEDGDT